MWGGLSWTLLPVGSAGAFKTQDPLANFLLSTIYYQGLALSSIFYAITFIPYYGAVSVCLLGFMLQNQLRKEREGEEREGGRGEGGRESITKCNSTAFVLCIEKKEVETDEIHCPNHR